jgi:hypothetical protein
MNLPSKSGIGYQLSNGDVGVLCNTGLKMLLKQRFDKLFYFDQHDVLLHTWKYSQVKDLNLEVELRRTTSNNLNYKGKVY